MFRTYPVALFALLLCATVARSASADGISAQWRREDSRLSRAVTLSAPRATIAELLAELSKQTGVALAAGAHDGAGDPKVTVFLHGVTLGDALDSLWSLVSYQHAEWFWARSGMPGSYRYVLSRPRAAQGLAARLNREMQEMFEADAELLVKTAGLSPSERRQALRGLKELAYTDDADALVDGYARDERMWAGLRAFSAVVPPAMRPAVLRGEASPVIPVSALPPEGRAFVHSVWADGQFHTRDLHGNQTPMPEPTTVYCHTVMAHSSLTMYIELGRMGGYGYAGGMPLERALRNKLRAGWMLPGDTRDAVEANRSIPVPDQPLPEDSTHIVESRMAQVADSAPLSLMARVTNDRQFDTGAPYGKTVRSFLDQLGRRPPAYIYKWRGEVLLLADPGWPQEEDSLPPAEVVSRLRAAESANQGTAPLPVLLEVVATLSPEQIDNLAEAFPIMRPMSRLHGLLRIVAPTRARLDLLVTPQGLALLPGVARAARYATGSPLAGLSAAAAYNALRFRMEENEDAGESRTVIRGEARLADGRWRPVFTIFYPARSGPR